MIKGKSIRIKGTVQGVGFRPLVWRYANEEALRGTVSNDAEGVLIQAWGSDEQIQRLVDRIVSAPPSLAIIESVEQLSIGPAKELPEGFSIIGSGAGEVSTAVAADAAICAPCQLEVASLTDRRYRYPFTNCTHCGPRFSIVQSVPYDRANTSMAPFIQCPLCQGEYDAPSDRRFHAQPNACPVCGPGLWLERSGAERLALEEGEDAIGATQRLLREGSIVAIKGIGGIQLACDAGNDGAVTRLRQRKGRYHKPFALMARDCEMVARFAHIEDAERDLLQSRPAPIVILDGQSEGADLAPGVAPQQQSLGFMLPYTALHHLLMAQLDRPIVLTSGNRSDEPQVIDNEDARQRLATIADYWLLHDRAIVNRLDDSVVRCVSGAPLFMRRARGYAPEPLSLHADFSDSAPILAMGSELKNTFTLLKGGRAMVSQHIGDLEDGETLADYRHQLALFQQLYDFTPTMVAVDRHPNYLSSQIGRSLAAEQGLELLEVQHHHAHIAAAMAESCLPIDTPAVLGVALDGLGFGDDGTLWGGEFLLADYGSYRRIGRFAPVAMPGGVQAIRQPWRNSYAHLASALGWQEVVAAYGDLEGIADLCGRPINTLDTMIERGLNSPLASSAGRLFDGVAALLGLCRDEAGYEGQGAIEMEALARQYIDRVGEGAYRIERHQTSGLVELRWRSLWQGVLEDLKEGVATGLVAARFHQGVINGLVASCEQLCSEQGLTTVVLSGGVFQNRLLLEGVIGGLQQLGLETLHPRRYPPNDGGVSLGQAVVAAAISRYSLIKG